MEPRRYEVVEGRRTLVVTEPKPLPQKMPTLLGALKHVRYAVDISPTGARAACEMRDHRFRRFREGRHLGLDGIVRDLRLEMCADCGAVCVRDISFDLAVAGERVPIGRKGPARRDLVLGWYSGARRNSREYR